MSLNVPVPTRSRSRSPHASRRQLPSHRAQLGQLNALSGSAPEVASYSIARDLEEEEEEQQHESRHGIGPDADSSDEDDDDDEDDGTTASPGDNSDLAPARLALSEQYRRPSAVAVGPRPCVLPAIEPDLWRLSRTERRNVRGEECSLLRDNEILPPKHPRKASEDGTAGRGRFVRALSRTRLRRSRSQPDEEAGLDGRWRRRSEEVPTETSALLEPRRAASLPYGGEAESPSDIDRKWEEAVTSGRIQTTWQREAKVLTKYSKSLILTFILQYSLTMASVFTVGHIGKVELGAVSLATMTANITGYAVYQGLATSLDTLCAQAYGSGKKTLVGLQLQRMIYFLLAITVPIGVIWISAEHILSAIVPEKETARLAGVYLKIILFGAPGYAAFESGKRFVQAQGLFSATLWVLLICAPLNAVLNWYLVWQAGLGFIGAPIAVAIVDNLLPFTLFCYVALVDGKQCWGGFEKRALKNWGPMIKLAVPGLVMVLAEFLAFEILTLAASYLSTEHLAAQSVLATLTALTFQIPFPVSIAASTRIANLIGATLAGPAKVAARVAMYAAVIIGIFNVVLLSSLRHVIPKLFTSDEDVRRLVADVLPLCAAFQLFDSLAANCGGILRGLGRQEIGGYVNLFAYYVIALPISFFTCFVFGFGLHGLWSGPALGLAIVFVIEAIFIVKTSWEDAVEAAVRRNMQS